MRLPKLTANAPAADPLQARAPTFRLPRRIDPVLADPDKQVTFLHEAAPNFGARPEIPRVDVTV